MKDSTEIIFVIDKSGSMESKKEDIVGGFNRFIEEQKKEPEDARVTVTLFDTAYSIIHNGTPLKEFPELTGDTYVPGGMTALLDAVGRTIDEVGARISGTPEDDRPDKVIMVIMTDGLENASSEYNAQQVQDKIKHQEGKYSWQFVYLGADMQGVAEAKQMLYITDSYTGTQTKGSINAAYTSLGSSVRSVRKGGDWKYTDSKN